MAALAPVSMRAALCIALAALAAGRPAQALPSTFAPVIGSALLCRSHLDNASFHSYLTTAFGPSYKREGGAWWFRLDATLWGQKVSEVMVSDDSSGIVFIGAVAETTPDKLEQAIRQAAGPAHRPVDASPYPLRVSSPGSTIAYFDTKSKIYCARFKSPPAR